jgi:hypothetical protein
MGMEVMRQVESTLNSVVERMKCVGKCADRLNVVVNFGFGLKRLLVDRNIVMVASKAVVLDLELEHHIVSVRNCMWNYNRQAESQRVGDLEIVPTTCCV